MARLDPDIRELANTMQQRRREAKKRVGAQEIMGMRFMSLGDVMRAGNTNWDRVGQTEIEALGSLADLADAANYALELIRRAGD